MKSMILVVLIGLGIVGGVEGQQRIVGGEEIRSKSLKATRLSFQETRDLWAQVVGGGGLMTAKAATPVPVVSPIASSWTQRAGQFWSVEFQSQKPIPGYTVLRSMRFADGQVVLYPAWRVPWDWDQSLIADRLFEGPVPYLWPGGDIEFQTILISPKGEVTSFSAVIQN